MSRGERRRRFIVTIYFIAVLSILALDRLAAPAPASVENELIFISDSDSIDASRESNSVYRIRLDGGAAKRVLGSIPHGAGYLRIADIDCHAASQSLAVASFQRDLNGFHHALLDGTGLHLDRPDAGQLLTSLRRIALAPDGIRVVVSRQFDEASPPGYGLVAGDLASRQYKAIKPPTAERSYLSPAWSPAGGSIAYIIETPGSDQPTSYALAIASPDGSGERLIHQTSLALSDIAWSPDGEWLALEISRQIYKLRPAGGELTRLSHHQAGASAPRWSPDGRRISFVAPSSYAGFNQLITMNADGGDIQQVANIRGEVVNGCWV